MEKARSAPTDIEALHDRVSAPGVGVVDCLRSIDGDVLVLGAGGKMGLHLSMMLRRGFDSLGKQNRVLAVSRFGAEGSRDAFVQRGIEAIPCDLRSSDALKSLPEAAAVYFLAGVKFGTAGNADTLRSMNQEVPVLVADRFRKASIVALSTGCVYPFVAPESGGCRETDRPEPVGDYALSCLGRERAFADASRQHGTRVALIRLNYSVDLRYGVLVDIGKKVLAGEPVEVRMGYFNTIWQGDALDHIVRALSHGASPPFVLNVTGRKILSVREVAEKFGEILEKKVIFTGDKEEPTAWLSDASTAYALFGKPSVPEDVLITWAADWLARGGETLDKPTHFEVRDGEY